MKEFLGRVPLLVWFLIPTLVLVVVGVFVMSSVAKNKQMDEGTGKLEAEKVSAEVEGTQVFPGVSRDHIQAGTTGSGYNSNPPSSGPHWPSPAKDGVYDKELADETAIHNLEHGYVWISYRPDIGEEALSKLKTIVEKDDWKMLLTLREKNDSLIALVAWDRVLKLENFDEEKIKDFIDAYRNRGPEKTPE